MFKRFSFIRILLIGISLISLYWSYAENKNLKIKDTLKKNVSVLSPNLFIQSLGWGELVVLEGKKAYEFEEFFTQLKSQRELTIRNPFPSPFVIRDAKRNNSEILEGDTVLDGAPYDYKIELSHASHIYELQKAILSEIVSHHHFYPKIKISERKVEELRRQLQIRYLTGPVREKSQIKSDIDGILRWRDGIHPAGIVSAYYSFGKILSKKQSAHIPVSKDLIKIIKKRIQEREKREKNTELDFKKGDAFLFSNESQKNAYQINEHFIDLEEIKKIQWKISKIHDFPRFDGLYTATFSSTKKNIGLINSFSTVRVFVVKNIYPKTFSVASELIRKDENGNCFLFTVNKLNATSVSGYISENNVQLFARDYTVDKKLISSGILYEVRKTFVDPIYRSRYFSLITLKDPEDILFCLPNHYLYFFEKKDLILSGFKTIQDKVHCY